MPATGRSKQEVVSEFRTSEILAAARKVFASKGFRDATMDEIAELSGISKATVYLYFPSKQEVYLAALMRGVEEVNRLTRGSVEASAGALAKIAAFIRTRIEYGEQHREFIQIYHSELGNIMHSAALSCRFKELYLEQVGVLQQILAAGMQSGEVRATSAPTLATAIYELTKGVMVARVMGKLPTTLEEDVEALCEFIARGIER